MKVKLFTAKSMQEAMSQVKNDLGRDAVILHTRRLRKGGILGFFSREMVEVMAAVDSSTAAAEPPVRPVSYNVPDTGAQNTALQLEIANMRKLLERVVDKIPNDDKNASRFHEFLIKRDIDAEITANLVKGLPDEKSIINKDPDLAWKLLEERIGNYLQRIEGIKVPVAGSKAVALIGPTGVGKTTTIAKLAANFAIKEGYKVALITADTYRISAVEQLKTYADIMGIPIDIVYSPDELKASLYRHRDKNLILIDTAGRSPRNQYQLAELKALLEVDPYIETHLVLSATTKYKDAVEVVKSFSGCSPQKFLFTKLDEAANIGTLFNILYQFPTTLSYVTTGQNVPDDIEIANAGKLVDMLLRG